MSNASSFPLTKIIGIALLVLGAGLLIWGYQLSDSVSNQVTEFVTGSPKDRVMKFYIGGAIAFVVGVFLTARK